MFVGATCLLALGVLVGLCYLMIEAEAGMLIFVICGGLLAGVVLLERRLVRSLHLGDPSIRRSGDIVNKYMLRPSSRERDAVRDVPIPAAIRRLFPLLVAKITLLIAVVMVGIYEMTSAFG